jgi:hypothetical protein
MKGLAESDVGLLEQQKQSNEERKQIYAQGAQDVGAAQQARDRADRDAALHQEMAETVAREDAGKRETARAQRAQELRQMHVDPQKWFKDKGTAGSILAAISMGAGAFAAAMPHTSNPTNQALGIINDAVNRDVNAQQSEIDKQFKELEVQGGEDEKAYIKDNHSLAQQMQRRLTAYDHANALVGDMRAKTTDQLQAKGLDDLSAGIGMKQNDVRKGYEELHVNVARREQAQAAAAGNAAKQKEREITELAQKLHTDPNFQPKEGMSREEAALRSAESIINRNPSNAGLSTIEKPGAAGKEKALSPRLVGAVSAATRGAEAAKSLIKLNPYGNNAWTTNPDALQGMQGLKGALDTMEPSVNHDWVLSPLSPQWKGRVAAAQDQLTKHKDRLLTYGKGGSEPEPTDEGVPGAEPL